MEYWDALIASTVRGRKWIAAFEVLGGLGRWSDRMARQGATGVFIVAGNRGTGELPPPGFARWRSLDIVGDDLMDGIRRYEAALLDLPPDVVDALDDFDPDRSARVMRTVFAIDHPVAGRASYGARPRRWVDELEDKTVVDGLWDAAGVERAPSAIVSASAEELRRAAVELDRGSGTVWAGDNSTGWHGGATHTRWVRDDFDDDVARFFAERSKRVRVMPFLEGIPCSIHGMVVGDDVIVFRPIELLIFRRPDAASFFYAGAATTWDPPRVDREAMREAARAVGTHIRDHHRYRGAFNLDGVLTPRGWLPTELNARFAAGLGPLQAGLEVSLLHLHLMMVEGEQADYRASALERALVESSNATRTGAFGAPLEDVEVTEERKARVVLGGDGCRFAEDDEEGDGTLLLGPGPSGGYLRFSVDHPEAGSSFAPVAAQVMALADREWGTGIGPVEPAPEVR